MLFGSELLRPATRYPHPLAIALISNNAQEITRALMPASPPISPHSPPAIEYCLPLPKTTSSPVAKDPPPASPTKCSVLPSHLHCSGLPHLPQAAQSPHRRRRSRFSQPLHRVQAPPTRQTRFHRIPARAPSELPAPPPSSRGSLALPRAPARGSPPASARSPAQTDRAY